MRAHRVWTARSRCGHPSSGRFGRLFWRLLWRLFWRLIWRGRRNPRQAILTAVPLAATSIMPFVSPSTA